jgi:hypothetical protein
MIAYQVQRALARAGGGTAQDGRNFRKDRADVVRDTGHDGTSGYGDKTGHESVLDEILAIRIGPDLQLNNEIDDLPHLDGLLLSKGASFTAAPSEFIIRRKRIASTTVRLVISKEVVLTNIFWPN